MHNMTKKILSIFAVLVLTSSVFVFAQRESRVLGSPTNRFFKFFGDTILGRGITSLGTRASSRPCRSDREEDEGDEGGDIIRIIGSGSFIGAASQCSINNRNNDFCSKCIYQNPLCQLRPSSNGFTYSCDAIIFRNRNRCWETTCADPNQDGICTPS